MPSMKSVGSEIWLLDEHERFMSSLKSVGKDWFSMSKIIATKNSKRTRAYGVRLACYWRNNPDLEEAKYLHILEEPSQKHDYWSNNEEIKFFKALEIFGKDWWKVSNAIGSKS